MRSPTGLLTPGGRRAIASRKWIETDWVQVLISAVPMAIVAVAMYRRNKS
ncbi:hypothetical protein AB0454_33700 [Streptomyces sp. NPDC093509]